MFAVAIPSGQLKSPLGDRERITEIVTDDTGELFQSFVVLGKSAVFGRRQLY